MLKPLSENKVRELFGNPVYREIENSHEVDLSRHWHNNNIISTHIPELAGLETYGGVIRGNILCHREIAYQFQEMFREIGEAGLINKILFWGGGFYPRWMRGTFNVLSRHTWGVAFDLNPSENAQGSPPAAIRQTGSLVELVPFFEKWGFAWGGNWENPDGMHIEVAKIIKKKEITPDMKIGICFSQTGAITSKLIRWFTRSEWSHVDLVMRDGSLIGALPFKGVVQRKHSEAQGTHKTLYVDVPVETAEKAYQFARDQLGKKYDWTAVSAFGFRRDWQVEKKWFCSELVFCAIKKAGVNLLNEKRWRVSPRDLSISPLLTKE